jgi:hypothetical protein
MLSVQHNDNSILNDSRQEVKMKTIGFRKSPLASSPLVPSALTPQFIFRVFFAAFSCKKYPKNIKQLTCELEGDFCEALMKTINFA